MRCLAASAPARGSDSTSSGLGVGLPAQLQAQLDAQALALDLGLALVIGQPCMRVHVLRRPTVADNFFGQLLRCRFGRLHSQGKLVLGRCGRKKRHGRERRVGTLCFVVAHDGEVMHGEVCRTVSETP